MSARGQCQCWTATWYLFSDNWDNWVFLAILDLLVAECLNWSEQYKEAGTLKFESEVPLLLVCKDVKLCDQAVHLSNSWESTGCDSPGGFWVFSVKVAGFPHSLQLPLSSQSKRKIPFRTVSFFTFFASHWRSWSCSSSHFVCRH